MKKYILSKTAIFLGLTLSIHASNQENPNYRPIIEEALIKLQPEYFIQAKKKKKRSKWLVKFEKKIGMTEEIKIFFPETHIALTKIVNYHIREMDQDPDSWWYNQMQKIKKPSYTWLQKGSVELFAHRYVPKDDQTNTELEELRKRVGDDLSQLFLDKYGEEKRVEAILYPTSKARFEKDSISDSDRFLALMEVEKGYNIKGSTIERFFQDRPIGVSNRNTKTKTFFLVPALFIGLGSFFEKKYSPESKKAKTQKISQKEGYETDEGTIEEPEDIISQTTPHEGDMETTPSGGEGDKETTPPGVK